MNKLTKLLFSVFTSVAIATSAFAGEFTVSGSAKATYTILSNTGTTGTHAIGKGLGISNEFSLTASGELDNGMTWSYAQDIDGATVQDDASITMGTDYGTIKICVSECGLSTKYAFDNSAYGIGSDNGYGHGAAATSTMQYGSNISSYNNVQYHLPADLLPYSTTFKVGVTPGGAGGSANASSHSVNGDTHGDMRQYAVTTAPIDGLKIGADYHTTDGQLSTTVQEGESGNYFAQYAMGNFKVGYSKGHVAPGLTDKNAAVTKYENTSMGIEFAVNDALSISYNDEEFEATTNVAIAAGAASNTKTTVTSEQSSIQVAYNLGGATLGMALIEVDNADYTASNEETKSIFTFCLLYTSDAADE